VTDAAVAVLPWVSDDSPSAEAPPSEARRAAIHCYQKTRRQSDRDELIVQHLGFVKHVLGRMLLQLPVRVDRENLESAGIMGLVEAAGAFDPDRGVAFTTFAYSRVRGAMLDELRRNCPLPQQMLERWSRLRVAYAELTREATPEELAERAGLSVTEVVDCLQAMQLTRPDSWYDELTDQFPDRTQEASDAAVDRQEQIEMLADLIEELPEQSRVVITLYYQQELRLREIGEVLNLSESRISRILSRAELQLREAAQRRMGRSQAED
jgi:RNA polymerase sigma factor for flagellar operon FliA